MRKAILGSGMAILVSGLASSVLVADEGAGMPGEQLFESHACINCHGADGKAPVSKLVPVLAGKPADELHQKATKILSGEGGTEESKLMHAAIFSPANCNAPPTDDEVKAITDWLAAQQAP
jgi:cytochrome c